jgi:hypothetical protein
MQTNLLPISFKIAYRMEQINCTVEVTTFWLSSFSVDYFIFLSFLIILFYLAVSRGFYLWIYRQLVGLLGRVIGPTQGLYLHTGQHNTEKRRHTSTPRPGFEPVISTFERPKTVPASDRSATEIGDYFIHAQILRSFQRNSSHNWLWLCFESALFALLRKCMELWPHKR